MLGMKVGKAMGRDERKLVIVRLRGRTGSVSFPKNDEEKLITHSWDKGGLQRTQSYTRNGLMFVHTTIYLTAGYLASLKI